MKGANYLTPTTARALALYCGEMAGYYAQQMVDTGCTCPFTQAHRPPPGLMLHYFKRQQAWLARQQNMLSYIALPPAQTD